MSSFGGPANPYGVAAGDFNGDGRADLAVASLQAGALSVLMGNGDGTFGSSQTVDAGLTSARAVAAVDLNGDGRLDLVGMPNSASYNLLHVLLGHGDGSFGPAALSLAGPGTLTDMAIVDANGDGRPDVLTNPAGTSSQVSVSLNRGCTP